jgi:hypothetical protein
MAGGGGQSTNTIQNAQPWSGAQPYLLQGLGAAQGLYNAGGPSPWIGPTFVGQTGAQTGAQKQQLGYANQVYGGLGGLSGADASSALNRALTGGGSLSALTAGQGSGASSALAQQLSGTPDYSAVQTATNAANQQVINAFGTDVLPGLNQKASFLNNPTGSIKDLNYAIPKLGQQMALNTQQAYLGEYDRAKAAQQSALGIYGQAATTGGAQALQGAALYPQLAGAGQVPGQIAGQIADTGQAYQQQGLNDIMGQYSALQAQPYNNLNWFDQLVTGAGGLGGQQQSNATKTAAQSPVVGAIGGGLTGYAAGTALGSIFAPAATSAAAGAAGGAAAGSSFGGWGALLGAGLGLAGFL